MKWNEVTRIDIRGTILVVKDAMVMFDEDELKTQYPSIACSPGEYVLEINVPTPFHAHRARLRRSDSQPTLGAALGTVDVDHGFVGFVDYGPFLAVVREDFELYEEWTATELDDELTDNFSGEISFRGEKLVYVKSGDGDGVYSTHELLHDGAQVGIECVFIEG